MHPPNRHHTVYSEIGDKVIAHVRSGSWLCKNAAAPKRSRITFGQITVKDASFSSLFGFVWLEKYHSRDLPNFCVFTQAGAKAELRRAAERAASVENDPSPPSISPSTLLSPYAK